MKYQDLRDFIRQLEAMGELRRIAVEVNMYTCWSPTMLTHALLK